MYDTVLVTGGAGFIGSHVCEALLDKDIKVVCVDDFNDYYDPKVKEENLKGVLSNKNFKLYRDNITDLKAMEAVFDENGIQAVVHIAARAGVRASIENPLLYAKTNVEGTLNLLELAKKFGIKKFVFASSSSVYGMQKIPFEESVDVNSPISPYAATKISGEVLCRNYNNLYKMPIVCLRLFTVYGPRGRPDMAPYKFMKLILEGREISMYGDGSSKRDYTYVKDIVDGFLKSLEKDIDFDIINLGNSSPVDLKTFIGIIEKHTGKKAIIKQIEEQPGDMKVTCANIDKARKLLDFNPKIGLDEGIKSMVKWYLSQK